MKYTKVLLCAVVLFLCAIGVRREQAQARISASLVVINEIDYDQPGTDNAEFIEVYNGGTSSVNLSGYALQLVNGNAGGASIYRTIPLLSVELGANDYFVVCGNAAMVANCDQEVTPASDLVQNGAPDAVALYSGSALVDTVSYEGDSGAPYTEGSGIGLEDDPNQAGMGIARCPNGADSDQNNADFRYRPITPGAANNCPLLPPFGDCGDAATPIHTVQGAGFSSPLVGNLVEIEGVVSGDFQGAAGLNGFFLQALPGEYDSDELTSEGVFVYDPAGIMDVQSGQRLRVQGTVMEFSGLTEIANPLNMKACGTGVASATSVSLPVAAKDAWERWEGMLVTINQKLYASDVYNLGRYGEVELAVNGRLAQPTNLVSPGAPALALQDLNDRSRIQLDDGSNRQNPAPLPPYLGADGSLRLGDTIPSLSGVLSQSYGSYEIHPTQTVVFSRENTRPNPPGEIPNSVKVVSFNVDNFFTTIDNGTSICGPAGNLECRGADTPEEFTRQRDKILSALLAMNADLIALVEIENNPNQSLASLVEGLNAALGAESYAYIASGTIGSDAIKVGMLYKPAALTPLGTYAILDSSVDPRFLDQLNRPSLAQTFRDAHGEVFTAVINHFKSKGSSCASVGDPDLGDGQGNCNLTRTHAAEALADWLKSDPTGSGDPDFLILGDLNSYAREDPITALRDAGYTNLIERSHGAGAYSYTFAGQSGQLDHAFASLHLASQALGADFWHIDADEPAALDYNDYNQAALYHPDAYRAADHDPLVVWLKLGPVYELRLPLVSR